ncbi:hypothetical protein, partial [Streptomyces nigra]
DLGGGVGHCSALLGLGAGGVLALAPLAGLLLVRALGVTLLSAALPSVLLSIRVTAFRVGNPGHLHFLSFKVMSSMYCKESRASKASVGC